MHDAAHDASPWTLLDPLAEVRCGTLSGRIDISQPGLGLHQVALGAAPLSARLLCITHDDRPERLPSSDADLHGATTVWPVADAYVRGSDLVAGYQPTADWPFSPQIDWRADVDQATTSSCAALSLYISVQTQLLDTWPDVNVQSHLEADEVLYAAPDTRAFQRAKQLLPGEHIFSPATTASCIVHRFADGKTSYAEIMPASDFREVTVRYDAAGVCHTNWHLFADFLEKGVIWRARLHALLLPRENDIERAMAFCSTLDQRPLPLTT